MTSAHKTGDINQIVKAAAKDGRISCARGFELSRETGFSPAEIGAAMNENKIRISSCQFGLFGCETKTKAAPPDTLDKKTEDSIRQNLTGGKIPCETAWRIAEELKMKKTDIASACDKMNVKISACQLGAFK